MADEFLQWRHRITDTSVIGITGVLQIFLLVGVAGLAPFAAVCALFAVLVTLYALKTLDSQTDKSLLMITASGGLGMLLGSMLDMAIGANGFYGVHHQVSAHLHQHDFGLRILGTYMTLFMLLFCIPCCIIWCSKSGQKASLSGACMRHGLVGIAMLLGMLVFSHLALGDMDAAFPLLSTKPINPLLHHHLVMLIGMFLGALFGYGIYDQVEKRVKASTSTRRSQREAPKKASH